MIILTLFNVLLTLIVYIGAKKLVKYHSNPLTTPILTSAVVLIIIFRSLDISYEQYEKAKDVITYFLGPATVALAVPMYQNRKIILERASNVMIGIIVGTISTIVSAILLSKVFHLSDDIQAGLAVKAITTPVAVDTAILIGGDPSLTALFVITAGIFGAVFGPTLLTLFKITDPLARGIGIGTVSHGIGTSQAVVEGSLQGGVSSIAMGIAAIFTSILLPLIYPFIL